MSLKNFRDTVSSLKRKSVALKICPKCGCADVSVLTLTGFISQPMYVCNKCGFQNSIFLEVTREKETTTMNDNSEKGSEEKS